MAGTVKPKFSFEGVDPTTLDPDRIGIGSQIQDCAQITSIFERGAHSTASEAAVFAPLTRSIQNNKRLAQTAADSLTTYLLNPQESAANAVAQADAFGAQAGGATGGGGGDATQTDHSLQSLNVGTQQQSTLGQTFGERLLELARDCIPCDLRLVAFLELHPNLDLLGIFEGHLKAQIQLLADVAGLLGNFDIYGDFCNLLNLLSFLCIPDLQRIITTLMALLLLDVPKLDDIMGSMLQALIVPMFAPILLAITSLLDQFTVIVTNPLDCVIEAINLQLKKLGFELDPSSPLEEASNQLARGLNELNTMLADGKARIEDKLNFYIDQVKAMLGELGGGDSAYITLILRKLQIVRMIAFIIALIAALSRGHAACSSTKPPEMNEVDSFFQTYLNPNSPFNFYVDDNGQIHIDEDVPEFVETVEPLSEVGNVLQFEGEPLLDSTVALSVEEVAATLTSPIRTVVPCKLEVTASDAEQVNQWIAELNE